MLGRVRFVVSVALVLQVLASHQAVNAENQKSTPPRGTAVYCTQVSSEEYTHNGGRFDLFMQKVPGGKVIRLTNHRAHPKQNLGGAISEPHFSPNGKRITFLADYANSSKWDRQAYTGAAPYPYTLLNVWMMTPASHRIQHITKGDLGWHGVVWSPDGRYFSAIYPSKSGMIDQDAPIPEDIYVYDTQKGNLRKIARVPNQVYDTFWSSDSKQVFIQYSHPGDAMSDLYAVSRTGSKPKGLIKGIGKSYRYSLSPDGKRVAFLKGDGAYIANIAGSDSFQAIKFKYKIHADEAARPQWSKTGDKLAVAEVPALTGSCDYLTKLHIYDVASRKDSSIKMKQETRGITWSKDGRWVILEASDGLYAVSARTSRIVTMKKLDLTSGGIDWVETD